MTCYQNILKYSYQNTVWQYKYVANKNLYYKNIINIKILRYY